MDVFEQLSSWYFWKVFESYPYKPWAPQTIAKLVHDSNNPHANYI